MKITILFTTMALIAISCSTPSKLINTSSSSDAYVSFQTTTVVADVKVCEEKISYVYMPTKTVADGGYENIINSAIREALQSVGDYDVLVAKQTQVKYSSEGNIESVYITGYPGKYCNWRSSEKLAEKPVEVQPTSAILGKKK